MSQYVGVPLHLPLRGGDALLQMTNQKQPNHRYFIVDESKVVSSHQVWIPLYAFVTAILWTVFAQDQHHLHGS